ncbi:hypothetical protein [Planococcus salinus]|uniref:Uncharacterized protein n=1 Tax=Planococcus salinus TaxID=1848460 RepID=A0A3M8P2Z8_9BACL|nr:hypothetical protein [Planococcus salinus]RNF38115.1 hypothetical protein EEX84_16095 [Planococcus salinus]
MENKNHRVVYHLGGGVEAVAIVEAESKKEAATGLDKNEIIEFIGENETYFQFKLEDVKMVSVEEIEDTNTDK